MIARTRSSLRTPPFAYSLGPRARLKVTGPDAARYLEGQLSNSVASLPPGQAVQALLLTAKGKLCARVFVWKEQDAWVLDAEPELAEALEARVAKYIVADDVSLEPCSCVEGGWHVVSEESPHPNAISCERIGLRGWDTPGLPPGVAILEADEVELLRICQGIPAWGKELDETVLPHEARLEIPAVDFRKGCYVGQETVSRMQSVGRPTRRLAGLRGNFSAETGLELFDAEQKVGQITSAIRHFELPETLAIGYLNTRCQAQRFLVRNSAGEPQGEANTHEFPLF